VPFRRSNIAPERALGDRAGYSHRNVTSEAEWDAIVAATTSQFGRLDVLVNNAGMFSSRR
jgi:3alpha(or 20beta)-hydroxysteroid dehydrogenase